MATASVTVKLADLQQVQRLVVAAAQIIAGTPASMREWRGDHNWPVRSAHLLELRDALAALEAAKT